MPVYEAQQLLQYYQHVGLSKGSDVKPSLDLLYVLLRHQLARVPFECLALHYSTTRLISLDPQDLFDKVVLQSRGGYCLENNAFFKYILQSIGFHVISVVCRISNASRGIHDGGWRAMSHMANIVTIDNQRYLVDVGYGSDGPTPPVPLVSNSIVKGLPGQDLKLEHKKLAQHADAGSRVWVYAQKRGSGEWTEIYHFLDVEMFGPDFDVLNHWNMVRSSFAQSVVVQRFIADENCSQRNLIGSILLVRELLKLQTEGKEEVIQILKSEEERIAVLSEHFDIKLDQPQRDAISGRDSELK